jgi:hypothetical protein
MPQNGGQYGIVPALSGGRSEPHALLTASSRELTFLLALPAIVLLLPLFVIPFFGRRRYDA